MPLSTTQPHADYPGRLRTGSLPPPTLPSCSTYLCQKTITSCDETDLKCLANRADFIMSCPCHPAPPVCNVSSTLDYPPVDHFACADSPIKDLPDVNSLQMRLLASSSSSPGTSVSLPQAFWPGSSSMPLPILLEVRKRTPGPLVVLRFQGADSSILQIRQVIRNPPTSSTRSWKCPSYTLHTSPILQQSLLQPPFMVSLQQVACVSTLKAPAPRLCI